MSPMPRGPTPASSTAGASASPAAGTSADWPVYAHDPQRSGVNPNETAINPNSVGGLRRQWVQTLPELSGGSPILLHGVRLGDGTTADLLYVTTSHGSTVALNAASGAIVWRKDTSGPQIPNQRCQICAMPAADPSRQWVYAAGNDGAVHRYAAGTGEEDTSPPWPVTVTHLNGYEKRSSALNVANGYLYVALSGYFGDFGPYVGHVVSVRLSDGAVSVFNVLCSDQHQLLAPPSAAPGSQASCSQREAGVWARAGVVVDQGDGPTAGSLYIASGNGPFDANAGANNGGKDYGDSVLRLSGDGTTLLDSWTPATYQELDDRDLDLGSTAPALLPDQPNSQTPYLAVQGGKDGVLRLLNRAKLGGLGGELQAIPLNQGQILTSPAIWHDPPGGDWVFIVTQRATVAYRVATDGNGKAQLQEAWRLGQGGASPVIAGGVLFLTSNSGVTAHDPHDGHQIWSSAQDSAGGNIGGNHWQTPIVADGRLYIADEQAHVICYALP
jgi:outer membrane protein assembly factor BamB